MFGVPAGYYRHLWPAGVAFTSSLVAIAVAAGILLAPRVGLGAPLLATLAAGKSIWWALQELLPVTVAISLSGAVPFLLAYYF